LIRRMHNPEKRNFTIENLGCAKNQVDAEVMHSYLEKDGWRYVEAAGDAELIIINTCGFIRPAKEEAAETLFRLREAYPDKKILLAGCFAQRYGLQLQEELREADGIFGNHDLSLIGTVAEQMSRDERPVLIPQASPYAVQRSRLFSYPGSAYVKISEGCNHRCSFCAIPIIRGPLKSLPMGDVLQQIRSLQQQGVVEFNLIAQDLAAYGSDQGRPDFCRLLRSIGELEGDFWVRLLYIHPDNFPLELLSIMRDDPRILPYFDIPFQHASGKILRRMGRTGTATEYLDLVHQIRSELPGAVIRTTFMVGFPGEGRREYRELQRFQEEGAFDWAGVFDYSREEGTKAFEMQSAPVERLRRRGALRRKEELEKIQIDISASRMERFVGETMRILVEEKVREEDLALGRGYIHAPEVDGTAVILSGDVKPGDWIDMRVVKRNNFDLEVIPLDGRRKS